MLAKGEFSYKVFEIEGRVGYLFFNNYLYVRIFMKLLYIATAIYILSAVTKMICFFLLSQACHTPFQSFHSD